MVEVKEQRDLERENQVWENLSAEERVKWAWEEFGKGLVMSTSFGVQSAVLLHMVNAVSKDIPILFIDTGYHFTETYQFAEMLKERLELNLKVFQPQMTAARQEALYGKRWEGGLKALQEYNLENKVEPMNRALSELQARAWISGVRRTQASSREQRPFIELQQKTYKLYPIADWSDQEVYQYLTRHDLPYHPLWHEGYVSVGDWHSTKKLSEGMTEEETRFNGLKRECGLHESSGHVDYQI